MEKKLALPKEQKNRSRKLRLTNGFCLLFSLFLLITTKLETSAQVSSNRDTSSSSVASELTSDKYVDTAASNLLEGKLSEAILSYTAALKDQKLANDHKASLLNDRAVAYARDGQLKSAFDDFNAAAQLYPEYAPIYNNRGIMLISLDQYKEALKDFNRALLLSPKYAAAHNNRGTLYVKLGQIGDGFDDFNKAIELTPEDPEFLNSRGRANLTLKRPYSALRDFTHAVAFDPRFSDAYKNRAEAKIMLQAYSDAIEDYSRAIAFNPKDPEFFILRGEAFLMLRDFEAALNDYNRAIALNPKYEQAYTGRGLTQTLLGKYEEGISDLGSALELNPNSPKAYAYRALLRIKMDQMDSAKADIQIALKYDNKLAEVLWAKASLEEQLSQIDLARVDIQQALEQKPWLKEALDMQLRISSGSIDQPIETNEISTPETWRLTRRNGQILAYNDLYPRLFVPLDLLEGATPKILLWEVKEGPYEGYGVLKYSAGILQTSHGSEECEMIILLDLIQQRVVAIVPERQGSRTSTWTWDDNRVIVMALDGLRDEFLLLGTGPRVGPMASSGTVNRRLTTQPDTSDWAPWNQPLGMPDEGVASRKRNKNSSQKWKAPKGFFDFFFN